MGPKKIGSYLDSGSLGLFVQQILKILAGSVAVAIHDTDGHLVWAGPSEGDNKRCTDEPFVRARIPGPGYCEQFDDQNLTYVFYLDCEGSGDLIGTLSVMVESSHPVSFESAYRELQPVLTCIERQVVINSEFATVRQMSSDGRDGLDLLAKMSRLEGIAGPEVNLQSVLELSKTYFGCQLVAVSLPHLGIEMAHPGTALTENETAEPLIATLKGLNSAASKHKMVLVSDENMRVKEVKGSAHQASMVLCSPIVNSRDEVTGIFVLIGSDALPKESIRLVRAICAKISNLAGVSDQISTEHFSRHGLLHHMRTVLIRHPSTPHAFIYLDVDNLHVVNDSFGHMAGDHVIRKIIRIVDDLAGKTDAVCRLSGDKLGFFLRDCDEKRALEKAQLILQTIERDSVEYNGKTIEFSASIGVALMPDEVTDASSALITAEVAAKAAKESGGGRVIVFHDKDVVVVQRRTAHDQVRHLQQAFVENRFVLHAQPIQSLKEDEKSNRFEILVRMLDENDQVIPPDKFMSAAERYQMMSTLDRWVINKTLDALSDSNNTLEENLASFSINVSAQSLVDHDFVEHVARCIVESGVSPEALCFEIRETAVVRNLDRAQRFFRKLRKLGCRLALDNFGTGHSAFAYLKDLPVQYVKIDGVFIRDILENPLSDAIVASVANIAKVMRAWTVAEHVESDLVLQRLRYHDIDYVQGFAIARPRPLTEVLAEMGPAVRFDKELNLVRINS